MTMNHKPGPKDGSVYDEDGPSDELMHWGRKGMKWGVRKEYSEETQSKIRSHNTARDAAKKADRDFEELDGKLSKKGVFKVTDKEWKQHNKAITKNINAHAKAKEMGKIARKAKYKEIVSSIKPHGKAIALTTLILANVGLAIVSTRQELKSFEAAMNELSKPDPRMAEIAAKVARLPPIPRTGG